jgi:hypothetical protein
MTTTTTITVTSPQSSLIFSTSRKEEEESIHPSTMPPFLTPTICLSHLALTAYTLYLSYQNISRLQQYERTSEKAAQWSNTAADKLHKTRVTQASGVVSVRFLFLFPT